MTEMVMLPSKRNLILIAACFFALTFAIYGSSLFNEFVRWDDGLLITENPAVREISPRSIAWVFSHYDPELYIPLTFLTYQFDHLIGGQSPFIYHFTNLVLHTLNSLLVFLFLYLLTGRKWLALFCGLLFAVHPLHTEAVAWASARKDVLSGFFFLLSLVMYLIFMRGRLAMSDERLATRKNGKLAANSLPLTARWYVMSITAFLLGLLSKVSIILLPVVLLLIDFYEGRKITRETLTQKIPYFLLSFVFGLIALYGKQGGIISVTLMQTLLMAARSAVFYLQKLFLPTNLSVLYPAERGIELLYPEYLIPVLILFGLTFIIFHFRKNRTVVFSALFFLLMIAPSFQNFAKDGDFFFASDRYAYLGSIGIFFLISSFFESGRRKFSRLRSQTSAHSNEGYGGQAILKVIFGIIIVIFATLSFQQAKVWTNSETLFSRAMLLYPQYNARVYNNLGNVYRRQERTEEAIAMFKAATEISPHSRTYSNLGAVYRKEGRILEALETYKQAIDTNPEDAQPYFGLGLVYSQAEDYDKALEQYRVAIDRDPEYAEAYSNMGAIFLAAGDIERSITMYQEAIKANSLFVQAYFNLGVALAKLGRTEEAMQTYEAAIEISPDLILARINLGILYYGSGKVEEARNEFREILKRDPANPAAISALEQIGG